MNKHEIKNLVEIYFGDKLSHFSETWKADLVSRLMKIKKPIDNNLIETKQEEKFNELVEDFFKRQSPQFSDIWKAEILLKLKKLETDDEGVLTSIHEEKLKQIITICEKILSRSSNLDYERINNIVYEALLKWIETFNPDKIEVSEKPELHWLMLQVRHVIYDYSRGRNSKLDYADLEETFKSLADPSVQKQLENIVLENEENDLEDKYQTIIFTIEKDSSDRSEKRYAKKRVAYVASKEIFRYFLHTKRMKQAKNDGKLPFLVGSYKHNLRNFINFHQHIKSLNLDLSLLKTDSANGYAKMRHHVMSNANTRRWMELAVAKLRESKDKKSLDISNSTDSTTKDSIKKAPVLSSVAVCKDGRFFPCFKGQIDEIILENNKERNITWDKHCEYSLFVDVIKQENMSLIKGGTLFVTLEPCNKRGATGKNGERKAKIPCAVRCAEAGFDRIFVGSFDYDENIRGNGIEILKTGLYRFDLENGKHKGKDAEGSALLEKYFLNKGYLKVKDTKECRIYRIGKQTYVTFFDTDLMFEIYNINAEFQHKKIDKDNSKTFELDVV